MSAAPSIRVNSTTMVCECRSCGAIWQGVADQHTSAQCAKFQSQGNAR